MQCDANSTYSLSKELKSANASFSIVWIWLSANCLKLRERNQKFTFVLHYRHLKFHSHDPLVNSLIGYKCFQTSLNPLKPGGHWIMNFNFIPPKCNFINGVYPNSLPTVNGTLPSLTSTGEGIKFGHTMHFETLRGCIIPFHVRNNNLRQTHIQILFTTSILNLMECHGEKSSNWFSCLALHNYSVPSAWHKDICVNLNLLKNTNKPHKQVIHKVKFSVGQIINFPHLI